MWRAQAMARASRVSVPASTSPNHPCLGCAGSAGCTLLSAIAGGRDPKGLAPHTAPQTAPLACCLLRSPGRCMRDGAGARVAGAIKRWNHHRGSMTHGSKSKRQHGSIGSSATPSRVLPGLKMAGQMGSERKTIKNLQAGCSAPLCVCLCTPVPTCPMSLTHWEGRSCTARHRVCVHGVRACAGADD